MLTLFSIPKAFLGHIGVIQRNALASWCRLKPDVNVILFGSDPGVAEAAKEFGAVHVPELETNEFGTPLVSDAFAKAAQLSRDSMIMYSNADILFGPSLIQTLKEVIWPPDFILSGRRWDYDITADLTRASDEQWATMFSTVSSYARLHGPSGMDYFLFPRDLDLAMPRMAVGRVGWDSWLVWSSRSNGRPVIDATSSIVAIHQNHDYSQLRLGYQHTRGPERELNLRAAGGLSHLLTLREADLQIRDKKLRPRPWPQRFYALLGPTWAYQKLLAFKRVLS